jgi:flagellar biogenesis protein FliO
LYYFSHPLFQAAAIVPNLIIMLVLIFPLMFITWMSWYVCRNILKGNRKLAGEQAVITCLILAIYGLHPVLMVAAPVAVVLFLVGRWLIVGQNAAKVQAEWEASADERAAALAERERNMTPEERAARAKRQALFYGHNAAAVVRSAQSQRTFNLARRAKQPDPGTSKEEP